MKTRRHHNNKGLRQIKQGRPAKQMKALAAKLDIPYGVHTTTGHCSTDDQGGGGWGCDTCGYFGYMVVKCKGDTCPSCHAYITNTSIPEPYPFGGSDF